MVVLWLSNLVLGIVFGRTVVIEFSVYRWKALVLGSSIGIALELGTDRESISVGQ